MINLLPQEEQALIHKEYRLRFFVVCFSFILALLVFADILLIPSFALTLYRNSINKQGIESAASTEAQKDRTSLTTKITSYSSFLSVLKPPAPHRLPTDIISTILGDKTSDNILTSIVLNENTDSTFRITLTGLSKSRSSIVGFANSLRGEPGITSVDLPISDLAQDTSINFTLTITGTATL